MSVRVHIETYGCQMNVLDSDLVQGQLESHGYQLVDTPNNADVVLLNTCSVRDLSEQKVWSRLGRLAILKRKHNPHLVVGVLGCMAERAGEEMKKRAPVVDFVCGPSNLGQVPQLVDNALRQPAAQATLALSGHASRRKQKQNSASDNLERLDQSRLHCLPVTSPTQAYVRITRGCNKFCSYCIVPFTRGPEVHRSPDAILNEVRYLVQRGVVEITLLGQTVNHYVYREGGKTTSFADLLWHLHEAVPQLPRLRFLTSYPLDFTDETLDVMASATRICNYLHIPAQSGSNRMLRLMNRGYTVEEYDSLLQRAREKIPGVRLAGDMIVGFPGETEEDHQASIDLLHRAQYKGCFIFKYSPRDGTVAAKRLGDTIPDDIKRRRNNDLLDIQAAIGEHNNRKMIGTQMDVLVEGFGKVRKQPQQPNHVTLGWQQKHCDAMPLVRLRGRTTGDEMVAFVGPADLVGTITQVTGIDATPLTILGGAYGCEG